MPTLSPYPGCRDRRDRRAQGLRLVRGWIKKRNPHPKIVCETGPYCGVRLQSLVCRNHADPSLALFWCNSPGCRDRLIKVRMVNGETVKSGRALIS